MEGKIKKERGLWREKEKEGGSVEGRKRGRVCGDKKRGRFVERKKGVCRVSALFGVLNCGSGHPRPSR